MRRDAVCAVDYSAHEPVRFGHRPEASRCRLADIGNANEIQKIGGHHEFRCSGSSAQSTRQSAQSTLPTGLVLNQIPAVQSNQGRALKQRVQCGLVQIETRCQRSKKRAIAAYNIACSLRNFCCSTGQRVSDSSNRGFNLIEFADMQERHFYLIHGNLQDGQGRFGNFDNLDRKEANAIKFSDIQP